MNSDARREQTLEKAVRGEVTAVSDSLHGRAVAWAKEGDSTRETFDSFLTDVAEFQRSFDLGLRRLYANAVSGAELAPLPTEVFKWARVSMFREHETPKRFCTSGTTQAETGTHWFRSTRSYDAGALSFGRENLWGDGKPFPILLTPSSGELPHSSLVHMLELFSATLGEPEAHVFDRGQPDLARVRKRLKEAASQERPVLLMGTSFGFVYLLDALKDLGRLPLPSGSRIMHTGGFKGRTREIDQSELHAMFEEVFELPRDAIFGEYGMTELSSQFYARQAQDRSFVYREPPWAKVYAVDPTTLAPVAEGEVGIAKIVDLFNIDSAVAVLTNDRVRRVPGGFELLGRSPASPLRGCSLAIEQGMGSTT